MATLKGQERGKLLLRPTSSYCAHPIFQGRINNVAECEGGIMQFIIIG